jgi:sulfur carrier protein
LKEDKRNQGTVRVNGRAHPFRPGTVTDVLERQGIDSSSHGIAVAINGEVVSRSEWARHEVRSGDEIEVVGAVQGG